MISLVFINETQSSVDDDLASTILTQKEECAIFNRQHDRGVIGAQSTDNSNPAIQNRSIQRSGLPGVESRSGTVRMGYELQGLSLAESSIPMATSESGRIRQLQQLEAPDVLQTYMPRPQRAGRGRPEFPVAKTGFCIYTHHPASCPK